MKLRKLLRNTNTLLNSSWKSLTRLKKSNSSKFKRRSFLQSPPVRRESETRTGTRPELFKLERDSFTAENQTVSISQISLEAVIQLAASQMDQSAEIRWEVDQDQGLAEEVYEEMNFNGENHEEDEEDEDEYMEMNFRKL